MFETNVEPLAYTVPAAVRASGVARTRLYQLIGSGAIEAVKSGQRTLIVAASLRRYLDGLPRASVRAHGPKQAA